MIDDCRARMRIVRAEDGKASAARRQNMIRVLTIDDHPLVRAGIRSALAGAGDIEIVAEAADGEAGLAEASRTRPSVVILDISMPGMSGLEVLTRLKKQPHRAAVLVLSLHPEDSYAIRLLRAGASGYVNKEASPETLISAIRKADSGGKYVSPEVAERLALSFDPDFKGAPHERLSRREFEVMRLLASGKTVSEVGHELELSVKTVSTYRGRILEKTGCARPLRSSATRSRTTWSTDLRAGPRRPGRCRRRRRVDAAPGVGPSKN